MFYFLNLDSASNSKSYDKGKLLEGLFSKIVSHIGYTDVQLRQKKDNLEYDVVAKNIITGQKLIGEAKAYEKKISEQIMTFLGKMYIHWEEDEDTLGLFLSLSELTSDVKGQIDKIISKRKNFRYIVSEQIIDILVKHAKYMSLNQIKAIAEKQTGLKSGETYFLVTNRGDFYIQLLIPQGITLPTSFLIYDCYGQQIKDNDFYNKIKNNIDVLKELDEYSDDVILKHEGKGFENNFIGVLSGAGWFDYQFPAPPDKFIGREVIIKKFQELVEEVRSKRTNVRVCEILSRSGVGKSSITLKLNDITIKNGDLSLVVDCRNIRTETDILYVFQLLVQKYNTDFNQFLDLPTNQKEILSALNKLNEHLIKNSNKISIIFLDQFESVFIRPKIYNKILDFILECCSCSYNFIFCIARKNDQPTTYDESSEIDLNILKSISKHFLLEDFNLVEAEFLIDKMKSQLKRPLIKALKEQVLELSNGFPWLLKKICFHIIKLVEKGHTQTEIVQSGMQLEDLFNEELDALDEILRDFFYRLVYFLPATHAELTEKFNENDLSYKLKILQNDYRLIRLTGRTYDTYNDVLKEYIKTGKILLKRKYILRQYPNPIIDLFEKIVENDWSSIDQIMQNTKQAKGAINNKLKEMKQVELIVGTKDSFKPVDSAKNAYYDSKLNEYLNGILKRNSLVREVINLLQKEKQIKIEDLKLFLQKEMPFIDANESTWLLYARQLSTWLRYVNIAEFKDGILFIHGGITVQTVSSTKVILPSIYMQQLERFVETLAKANKPKTSIQLAKEMGRKSINGAIADCQFLNLIERSHGRGFQLNEIGKSFAFMTKEERKRFVLQKLNSMELMKEYAVKVNRGVSPEEAFIELCNKANLQGWSEETAKWKHKLLRNWLMYSGLISRKRKEKKYETDDKQIEMKFD